MDGLDIMIGSITYSREWWYHIYVLEHRVLKSILMGVHWLGSLDWMTRLGDEKSEDNAI